MKKNTTLKSTTWMTLGLGLAFAGTTQAAQRPLSDWTSRQGTYCLVVTPTSADCLASGYNGGNNCFLFVPPVANFLAWTTDPVTNGLAMDYAGIANAWLKANGIDLATTISGTVSERPQADGTAIVSVVLQTHNALTFAVQGTTTAIDLGASPLLFGCRAPDVLAGQTPALGDCTLQLTFVNTAPGAPLPDVIQLLNCPGPSQSLIFLGFSGSAYGPLRAAFGVPDGTPGFAQTRQSGLLQTFMVANSNSRVALDAFPAEKINLQAISQ